MDSVLAKIGGRKFTLTVLVFILTTVLLVFKKLQQADYYTLIQMLLVSYPLANVGQNLVIRELQSDPSKVYEADPLGGRKFQFAIISFLVFVGILYFDYITAETYSKLTMWLVGVYITGNVVGKAIDGGLTFSISKKT